MGWPPRRRSGVIGTRGWRVPACADVRCVGDGDLKLCIYWIPRTVKDISLPDQHDHGTNVNSKENTRSMDESSRFWFLFLLSCLSV